MSGAAPASAIRDELQRVLASPLFRSSARLSRFLTYIVDATLDGRQSEIKEYALGVEVCERGARFDPRIDPIVRIDARRLRTRLREYYSGPGAANPLRILLEPGAYVPSFDGTISRTSAPTAPARSVAVLPFQNLGAPDDDALCDGLTDGLITALAQTPGLKVVARTSSFLFRDAARDVRELGPLLSVGGIIEGTVQHAGRRWRVTVRLVGTADGCVLWSGAFDCSAGSPFDLQDEIIGAVCGRLGVEQPPHERPARRVPDAAWTLYSKARHLLQKWNPSAVERAAELFEGAIDEHPEFAQAYAGLASARSWLAFYGVSNPRELLLRARFSAEKAIAIDASTAEAWSARGAIRAVHDWDWDGVDHDYHRALTLNSADAAASYASLLAFRGRLDESHAMIDRAMLADPLSLVARSQRALAVAFSGDDHEAVRLCREILDLEPRFARAHWALAIACSRLGRFDEALASYDAARQAVGDTPFLLGWQGHCLALAGRREDALALEAQLDRTAAGRFVPEFAPGLIRLGLGDYDGALDRFEAAVEQRTIWTLELKMSATFQALRGRARYEDLLRRMRLA